MDRGRIWIADGGGTKPVDRAQRTLALRRYARAQRIGASTALNPDCDSQRAPAWAPSLWSKVGHVSLVVSGTCLGQANPRFQRNDRFQCSALRQEAHNTAFDRCERTEAVQINSNRNQDRLPTNGLNRAMQMQLLTS